MTSGTVAWKTGGRELLVDRDSFLVLNHGEPYSMHIDAREPVSTLCVFFAPGFVESVCGSIAPATTWNPRPPPPPSLQRLHAADARILPRMQSIADAQLADQSVDRPAVPRTGHRSRDAEVARCARRVRLMPARRAATREELFRRVRRGQEFLHAVAETEIDLGDLAREACLSPYHFHRAFTRAFGQTPHAVSTTLRLARARRLLEITA